MGKDTYCSHCGKIFAEQKTYPRVCFYCGNTAFANPIPVVVVLAIVEWIPGKPAILIQQRNIEPKKGCWALTSGYVNLGETWQQAAARELNEEVQIVRKEEDFKLWNVDHSTNGNILIFCTIETNCTMFYKSAEWFKPNDEVLAVDAIEILPSVKGLFKSANAVSSRELAFPSHLSNTENYIVKRIKGLSNGN